MKEATRLTKKVRIGQYGEREIHLHFKWEDGEGRWVSLGAGAVIYANRDFSFIRVVFTDGSERTWGPSGGPISDSEFATLCQINPE